MSNSAFQTILLILPSEQLFPFFAHFACSLSIRAPNSPTYFEHLAVNMSLIKQGYVFPASVACGGVELPGIASSTTLFRSNPLFCLRESAIWRGEPQLCFCCFKAVKPISSSSLHSTQVFSPLVSRPFCRKLDQGLLLSLLSFLRAQQRTLQFGIRVGDLVAWYVGRGAECLFSGRPGSS